MSLFDGVDRLRGGLDYHLARQNLLTANLTHLDTPGYKPVDLERQNFSAVMHTELAKTDASHLEGTKPAAAAGRVIHDPETAKGLDGNGVNVDREAAKIAANQVRYDVLAQLVQGELSGLQWAANDGRSG